MSDANRDAPDRDAPGGDQPERPAGRVHDLGYERYDGPRRPQSTRYRTIIRHVVTSGWRGFWRMKAWVLTAALTTCIMAAVMYLSEGLSELSRGGQKLALTDALVPMAFSFLGISALPLSFTVLASMIADDLRTGAFEFYFSRPVRTRDYVMGKLGGALVIMALVLLVGPVLLALFRIGLAGPGQMASTLPGVAKAAVVGAAATIVYAAVPVAFSAISSRKRHTLSAWAAFYFMIGGVAQIVAQNTGVAELELLNLSKAVAAFAFQVFDVRPIMGAAPPSGWLCLVAMGGYVAVSVGVIYWRVAAAERAGMGGG